LEEKIRKPSKLIIQLHDNVRPHTANLTKVTSATMGWQIMNHPQYNPDLALSDIDLFEPMKMHLGGQKFRTDDELRHSVLNWLYSRDKTFYAPGS
jgi:hypothetical protein